MRTNENMAIRPIITLTTDFGLSDPYVAAMKGVILGLNPEAAVVDVTHEVRPQRLIQAVFVTQAAWPAFPSGGVHIVVVDPGVGGSRQSIVLVTPQGCFLGPDNGVLSAALPDGARPPSPREGAPVAAPDGCRIFTLTNHRYLRHPVSATFHGRDIFAPAAAHVSLGVPPEELGDPVETLMAFPPLRACHSPDGTLQGQVVHVDRFGNVITDIRGEDLPADAITVELTGQVAPGPVRTYAEGSGLVALVGSGGYLEVALVGGSAADALHVEIGDPVLLRARH